MLSSALNSQISYVYDSKDKHNASIRRTWHTKSESKDKEKKQMQDDYRKKLLSGLSSPPKRRSKRVAFDKERMRYGRIWVGAGRQDAKLVPMYNLHKCRVGLKASTKRVSF